MRPAEHPTVAQPGIQHSRLRPSSRHGMPAACPDLELVAAPLGSGLRIGGQTKKKNYGKQNQDLLHEWPCGSSTSSPGHDTGIVTQQTILSARRNAHFSICLMVLSSKS